MAEVWRTITLQPCIVARADNRTLSVETLVIGGTIVKIETRLHETVIIGASCHDCCDEGACGDHTCPTVSSTHRYTRHTLASVFSQLREMPDKEKLLTLYYINRYKDVDGVDVGTTTTEHNDTWWFNYIKENYEHTAFYSCTLFDADTVYGTYSRDR